MVKYERAGYHVAYSRDAGEAPFVTIVMQKLPDRGEHPPRAGTGPLQ